MTLKNEIFEGIAAAKGVADTYRTMTGTGSDRYYDYMLAKAKEADRIMKESEEVREREKNTPPGSTPGNTPPTYASTGTPGSGEQTWPPGPNYPGAVVQRGIFGFPSTSYPGGTPPFNPDAPRFEQGGAVRTDDPFRRQVDRGTREIRREQIGRDLDKPQLSRPGADQYMREEGYPNRFDVPQEYRALRRYAGGGPVSRGYGSRTAAPGASLGSVIARGPSQEPSEADDLVMSLLGDNAERVADESVPNTRARRGMEPRGLQPPGEMDTASTPGVGAAIDTGPPMPSAGPLPDAPPIPASMRRPPTGLVPQTEVDSATGMQPARQLVDAEVRDTRPTPRPQRATPRIAAPDADLPGITSEELAGAGEQPPEGAAAAPAAVDTSAPGRAKYGATDAPVGVAGEPTRTSNIGRFVRGLFETTPLDQLYKERTILIEQRNAPFAQRTEQERQDMDARIAALDGEIAALEGQQKAASGAPAAAGSPAAGGQGSQAPGTPGSPALQTSSPYGKVPGPMQETGGTPTEVRNTGPYPNRPPARPTSGTNTPGGNPRAASPPSTSRLDDPRRTKAFNPDDPNDAAQAQLRGTTWQQGQATDMPMQPQPYTNEQLSQALSAGMQAMPQGANGGPPVVGQGANSRPVFQAFVNAHNGGGTLTPGMAMVRGLVAQYQFLVGKGRPDLAQKIAASVIQAANLEAGSYGMQAVDAIRSGNGQGAAQLVAKGLDMIPDNMNHKVGPDGKSIVVSNQQGQQTGTIPLNGALILKIAMGLSDGTMMWQALQAAAQYGQKPDVNAEGRALTNELRRRQIEGAGLRNDRLRRGPQGKPGVAATGAGNAAADILAKYGPQTPDQPPRQERSQGSDDGGVSIDYDPPEPT